MSDISTKAPHIQQLREHLMATLADLRDRTNPMEPDRARAVAQVASVLIDTAKVEVEFLKVSGHDKSTFLQEPPAPSGTHQVTSTSTGYVERAPGVTRHSLAG